MQTLYKNRYACVFTIILATVLIAALPTAATPTPKSQNQQAAAKVAPSGTWSGTIPLGISGDVPLTIIVNQALTSVIESSTAGTATHPAVYDGKKLAWRGGWWNETAWTLTPTSDGDTAIVTAKSAFGINGAQVFRRTSVARTSTTTGHAVTTQRTSSAHHGPIRNSHLSVLITFHYTYEVDNPGALEMTEKKHAGLLLKALNLIGEQDGNSFSTAGDGSPDVKMICGVQSDRAGGTAERISYSADVFGRGRYEMRFSVQTAGYVNAEKERRMVDLAQQIYAPIHNGW